MHLKVKFFGSNNPLKTTFSGKEHFFEVIEREINTWLLTKQNIDIVEIKQSASGGSLSHSQVMISVWYRENKESQA